MNLHHSNILIHWTSKELAEECPTKPDIQDKYVTLLHNIYAKGLRFSTPKSPDVIVGVNRHSILEMLPIICFSELQFSKAKEHAKRYGSLGIGFDREFLMRWGANPVFYMQSKNQGIVNTNLYGLSNNKLKSGPLKVFLSYIKPMGEPCSNDYCYYDECEWRIVASKLGNQWPELFIERDNRIWFDFKPKDVLLLAFPNEDTRIKALADSRMKEIFKEHMPMMVDTLDCQAF